MDKRELEENFCNHRCDICIDMLLWGSTEGVSLVQGKLKSLK